MHGILVVSVSVDFISTSALDFVFVEALQYHHRKSSPSTIAAACCNPPLAANHRCKLHQILTHGFHDLSYNKTPGDEVEMIILLKEVTYNKIKLLDVAASWSLLWYLYGKEVHDLLESLQVMKNKWMH
ncbi:hypothetical protein L1987_59172 [Smallanthus sonchifolius]|uniref:Uncharacterized protein n=1 Tax=Smallanthus sonchifolius TaxID=185202 RepID=A0ACB9D518_9ASTR|nr:hypothetical protein L1987_59172 [Smallanthus sonchifolius]